MRSFRKEDPSVWTDLNSGISSLRKTILIYSNGSREADEQLEQLQISIRQGYLFGHQSIPTINHKENRCLNQPR